MNATYTPPSAPDSSYEQQWSDLFATNCFGIASFVVLLYDHILMFDDEVRYVWGGHKKLVSWLFLINRYVTPLGFAVNINAYTSRKWTDVMFVQCDNFVRYEGAMTLIGISVASLMMGIRVVAIYHGNRFVQVIMAVLFLVMLGVNAWLLTAGERVHHPTGIHGCSMIFSKEIGGWASASAWLPLLYDTVVVIFVLFRTRRIVRVKIAGQSHVINTLIHDGLRYYSVILAANLVLAIMISKSTDGLKNICAQFQLLITVTMMSRITLNLHKNMQRLGDSNVHVYHQSSRVSQLQPSGLPEDSQEPRDVTDMDLEASILDICPEMSERRSA